MKYPLRALRFAVPTALAVLVMRTPMVVDPEIALYLFLAMLGFIGAVVEWRRGGRDIEDVREELRELRIDVGVMKETKVDVGDWGAIDARCQYVERIANRMLDEFTSDDDESDAGKTDGNEDESETE